MKGYKMEPYLFDEKEACGTVLSLEEFIKQSENASITDDDGVAVEMIMNGFVVSEIEFYPSELLELKNEYLSLQENKGEIKFVWYNK
ncbi:hypothetical protein D3C71_1651240 [compost metagenome]